MWHALVQVKGEPEAVTDALKQLSALLRTHSQRKPQQVTLCLCHILQALLSRLGMRRNWQAKTVVLPTISGAQLYTLML